MHRPIGASIAVGVVERCECMWEGRRAGTWDGSSGTAEARRDCALAVTVATRHSTLNTALQCAVSLRSACRLADLLDVFKPIPSCLLPTPCRSLRSPHISSPSICRSDLSTSPCFWPIAPVARHVRCTVAILAV